MRWIFVIILLKCTLCQNLTKLSERELNGIIQNFLLSYDKTERASIDEQLIVTVDTFIQTVSDVREAQMDYEIGIFFRQVNI